MINLAYFIDRFSKNRGVFEGLVRGTSFEQARWKPTPEKWSMLEVVNHLYDEEREDFRPRIELALATPAAMVRSINFWPNAKSRSRG